MVLRGYQKFVMGVLTLLSAMGVFLAFQHIKLGLVTTGLHEPVVWGGYLVNFTFCFGLGAGLLIVLTFISTLQKRITEFQYLAAIASFICLSLAAIFIILDLGRPERFFYAFIYPHPLSPIFWDSIVFNIVWLLSILFCFATWQTLYLESGYHEIADKLSKILGTLADRGRFILKPLTRPFGKLFISILVLILYFATPAEVFRGFQSRPLWNTPVLNFIFLVTSILCGLSVLMYIRTYYPEAPPSLKKKSNFELCKKLLFVFLILDMAINFLKFEIDRLNPFVQAEYSLFPFSFICFLIIGNIIPLVFLYLNQGRKARTYRWIFIVIIIGQLLKRYELIIPAYYKRWLPFAPDIQYSPTLFEILFVVSIYCAGVVVFLSVYFITRRIMSNPGEKLSLN